jgi:beta-lactamase class A
MGSGTGWTREPRSVDAHLASKGYAEPDVTLTNELLEKLRSQLAEWSDSYAGLAGFCIRDLNAGTAIGYRHEAIFPAASTIKIHILAALLTDCEAGKLSPTKRLRVDASHGIGGGGILDYMENPIELSLVDIAILMIMLSDNTATNMCLEAIGGVERVNSLCRDLGLLNTTMRRVMRDRDAIRAGRENVTTPLDLVNTLTRLYEGQPSRTVADHCLEVLAKFKPSPFRSGLPAGTRIAHKTGRMAGVRHEAAIVFLPERPYALSVMTSFSLHDDAEQDEYLARVARLTHRYMKIVASSNEFGQGLLV